MNLIVEAGISAGDSVVLAVAESLHGQAGRALRDARLQKGLSLGQIADITRISSRYLSAIEACHFDDFIAPIFAVGFAKSYARTVDVCENWVAGEVREELKLNPYPRPSELLPAPSSGARAWLRWLRLG